MRRAASPTQAVTWAASVTSTAAPQARAPKASCAAATPPALRAQNATCAPSARKHSTIARPMPREPPLTSTLRPCSPRSMRVSFLK